MILCTTWNCTRPRSNLHMLILDLQIPFCMFREYLKTQKARYHVAELDSCTNKISFQMKVRYYFVQCCIRKKQMTIAIIPALTWPRLYLLRISWVCAVSKNVKTTEFTSNRLRCNKILLYMNRYCNFSSITITPATTALLDNCYLWIQSICVAICNMAVTSYDHLYCLQ